MGIKRAGDVKGVPAWQRSNFYYCPGAATIRGQRLTIADRIRMRMAKNRRRREWRAFCG